VGLESRSSSSMTTPDRVARIEAIPARRCLQSAALDLKQAAGGSEDKGSAEQGRNSESRSRWNSLSLYSTLFYSVLLYSVVDLFLIYIFFSVLAS